MPLNGPGKLAGRLFRCPQVGPEIMLRVAFDAIEWPEIMPRVASMPLNGPGNNAEKCFQLHWMGPEKSAGRLSRCPQVGPEIMLRVGFPMQLNGPRNNAQGCFPMQLNGPRNNAQECFRFYWMGPEIMPRNASDCIGWAQNISWETLSMFSGGPRNNAKGCFRCP